MYRERDLKSSIGVLAGLNLLENENTQIENPTTYNFYTGIATEFISNPYEFLSKTVDVEPGLTVGDLLTKKVIPETKELRNKGVYNYQMVETMPMNSLFANIIDDRESFDGGKPVVCYPFFPPHLSLPVKPGEYVWIIASNVKGVGRMFYWMCRKVGPIQVDDPNYTHLERLVATEDVVNIFGVNQGARNVSPDDLEKCVSNGNATEIDDNVGNLKNTFNELYLNSFSYRQEFTGEPVPRIARDCGDLLLQGSNNAGLHITTEKFTPVTDLSLDDASLSTVGPSEIGRNKPNSPAIDLFVYRKKEDINKINGSDEQRTDSVNFVRNNSPGDNDIFNYIENDKVANIRYRNESAFNNEVNDTILDSLNVGARLYMSNRCLVDDTFDSNFDILSSKFGPCIVSFAEHNRVIASSDVRLASLTGESFIDMDDVGNIVAKSSINDGQQFLSLGASGITRLNAKSSGEIHLAVRNDDGAPTEPYILYSELRGLLEDIASDLVGINTLLAALSPAKDVLDGFAGGTITSAESGLAALGVTKMFAEGAKFTTVSCPGLKLPTGKLGSGNTSATRGTIASSKIFGE